MGCYDGGFRFMFTRFCGVRMLKGRLLVLVFRV